MNQINLLTKNNRQLAKIAQVEGMQQTLTTTTDNSNVLFKTQQSFSSQATKSFHEAEDWDDAKVKNWLNESGIEIIYEILKPLSGKILYQLYQLQLHTPEFFFKSITKNESLDIKLVAMFSSSLKDLFS